MAWGATHQVPHNFQYVKPCNLRAVYMPTLAVLTSPNSFLANVFYEYTVCTSHSLLVTKNVTKPHISLLVFVSFCTFQWAVVTVAIKWPWVTLKNKHETMWNLWTWDITQGSFVAQTWKGSIILQTQCYNTFPLVLSSYYSLLSVYSSFWEVTQCCLLCCKRLLPLVFSLSLNTLFVNGYFKAIKLVVSCLRKCEYWFHPFNRCAVLIRKQHRHKI